MDNPTLTPRDLFAGMALMSVMAASDGFAIDNPEQRRASFARTAACMWEIADAMMVGRSAPEAAR